MNSAAKHRALISIRQGGKCCYCGETLKPAQSRLPSGDFHPRAATIEHLHRKVDGGSNALGNKAVACRECNTGRGALDWLTYKSLKMGELVA